MKPFQNKSLKNLYFLVRGYRRSIFFLFIILLIVSLLEAIGLGTLYPIIDILQSPEKINVYGEKINSILFFNIESTLVVHFIIVGIMILFIIKNLFVIVVAYLQNKFLWNMGKEFKSIIFGTYLAKPYSFFVNNNSGELVHKLMVQTDSSVGAIYMMIDIFRMFFTILAIYTLMCIVSFKVTIVITLVFSTIFIIFLKVSKSVHRRGVEINVSGKNSYGMATEVITGIRQVKIFTSELYFLRKFKNILQAYTHLQVINQTVKRIPTPTFEIAAVAGVLSILFFATVYMPDESKILPSLAVFAGGFSRMLPLIAGLSTNIMTVSSSLPCINTVAELLKEKKEIKYNENKIKFTKELSVRKVSYEYESGHTVLSDINMNFKKGHFYGIAGPSGSGKSTLIDLLIGFIQPVKGQIMVDGNNLNKMDISGWRKKVGVISQDTFIFSGSIEENISFALIEDERDNKKILDAAHISDASEFIEKYPQGYKMLVGERGLKLSGGQRQRLAIARAVHYDPDILIFDEATSSLDSFSEQKIQKAIEELSKEKTVIVIAHRLPTIFNADHIYVMDNGIVVEEGTHRKLKENGGLYSRLCVKQGL